MVPTLLLLFSCVDYDLHDPEDAGAGSSATPPGLQDSDVDERDPWLDTSDPGDSRDSGEPPDEDPPEDDDPPWDYTHPPKGEPPERTRGSCEDGTSASFSPGEIYVLSWSDTTASGTLHAPEEGWYHVFNQNVAESGATQRNESAYFRVTNSTHPSGKPRWSNCGDDWVLPDQDNNGTTALYYYIGTFWLDAGDNALAMHHYCPEYRTGTCTWMHDGQDSDKTCDSGNVNSVHFVGSGLCVTDAM
jgi:hypothetical protein